MPATPRDVEPKDIISYDGIPCVVVRRVERDRRWRKHITVLDLKPVWWGDRDETFRVFVRTNQLMKEER